MTRYIAILIGSIFLFIGSLGFLVTDHFGHDTRCPFMPGMQCVMSPTDHRSLMQRSFAGILPNVVVFVVLLLGVWIYSSHTSDVLPRLGYSFVRYDLPPPRPLQELYSQGILNSKAP